MSDAGGLPREVDLRAPDQPSEPAQLALLISFARLVCFPTDTVYGIGGTASERTARAIVEAKGRDEGKPLQVVYADRDALLDEGPFRRRTTEALLRLLPGPFTVLLPYPDHLSFPSPGTVAWDEPGGGTRTVPTYGVRVPRWPAGAASLAGLPYRLLASSANPSGGRDPASLDEVDPSLLAACDLVLDAGPVAGVASTVVDLSVYDDDGRWRILREGAVSADEVAALLAGERQATRRRGG